MTEETGPQPTLDEGDATPARLRMLSIAVDQSPAAVFITDPAGTIEYVNRRFTEITGYSAQEAVGRTPRLLKSGRTSREVYEDLWGTIRQGRPWRGEIMNRRKSGELYWGRVSISPMRGPDGSVSNFVAVQEDVTEQRWAESRIREREERFRQIADNIREVFFVVDCEFRETVYINPAYEAIWGRSCRSAYENPASFMEGVHPSDRPALLDNITSVRAGEDPGTVDFRVIRPDGEQRWVTAHAAPVRDDRGVVYRLSGVALDVTERRRTEALLRESGERFRKLADASFDAIAVTVEGTYQEVNSGFVRSLGYEPEEIIGRSILDSVAQESREEVRRRVEQGIEGTYELALIHEDGRKIMFEATARSHEIDGKPGRVTALRDMTGRRALEEQVRQAQKLEAVGRLAGGVAHDFNNLLTVILAETQLLRLSREPVAAGALDEALEEIELAAKRAATLTRQLLTFSRRDVVQPVVLDPGEVMVALESMIRRLVGEDVELLTTIDDGVSRVRMDKGHLEQVIMNLVVNARDAMPHGGHLRIELEDVDLDASYAQSHPECVPGRHVMIAISDDGTGMSDEVKERIFEPLFTTKPAGKAPDWAWRPATAS